jgi:hypothetical protein
MNPQGQPGQNPPGVSPNGVPPIPSGWGQSQPSGSQPQQNTWQRPEQPFQQQAPQTPPQQSPWPTQPQMQQQAPYQPQQPTPIPDYQPQAPFTPPSGANGQSPEYSIDYLNQIAPKEQRVVNRFAVFGLIGGGIFAAIFALILISASGGPSANDQLIPISERITTLQSVTTTEQTHLAEDQISQANAALSSSLSSMTTSMKTILTERKLKDDAGSSSAKAEKAYAAKLTTTLENSYQRGTLDRTYTSQMTYELTVLRSRITKLKQSSGSKEILSFCDTALSNIDLVLKAYSTFDATKS